MIRDWVTHKLRLPNFETIRIDDIWDLDADLVDFLCNCTPALIQNLIINLFVSCKTGVKSEFYIDAFSESAARTVKQVFFKCIKFSSEDLQTIVRAASNAEEILLWHCCIHCSPGLDFGADLNYKTKLLGFTGWGDTKSEERTTDWKSDPSKFSFIVNAIAGSGLKVSLQKLNIYVNQTLSVSKIQAELDAKGMPHISVVEEM